MTDFTVTREVDVLIVGAGTAGLNAVGQVRQHTTNFLLVDGHEELGTTCARVGCMPSKALIHIADEFHARKSFAKQGIEGADALSVDGEGVMERVQDIRDILVDRVLSNSTDQMGDKFLNEYAEFLAPDVVRAGKEVIRAKAVVLAPGSRPVMPSAWAALNDTVGGEALLTTDEIFEQESIPTSMAVIGLGVIGLELGQAFSRLGVAVTGFDALQTIAGIEDDEVKKLAVDLIGKDFPLYLGQNAALERDGDTIRVTSGETSVSVEKVLVSVGRRSNLDRLGLDKLGIALDERGLPAFDRTTMQLDTAPNLFIAGDANEDRAILHEAGLEGRIAGRNAARLALGKDPVQGFRRNTPLHITFSDPNICAAGAALSQLDAAQTAVGSFPMGPHGRALTMGNNQGIIRVYAEKASGKLLGAAMVAPRGENLAHLLNWAIEDGQTVFDLLRKPFYHPVFEEALQGALRNAISQLDVELDHPPELQPL